MSDGFGVCENTGTCGSTDPCCADSCGRHAAGKGMDKGRRATSRHSRPRRKARFHRATNRRAGVPTWGFLLIVTAQVIALYVMGCCIGGIVGCNSAFVRGLVSVADCSATSSLGCTMQYSAACDLPGQGVGWDDYGMCLSNAAQSCATESIARCAISGMMRATGGPIIAGGTPCDQEEVDLCVMGSMCEGELGCAEAVARCYTEVCSR